MKRTDLPVLSADDTCYVWCPCGWEPFIAGDSVYRRPNCGRGYRSEFVVYEYEPGETDSEFSDAPAISAQKGVYPNMKKWGDG